MLSYFDEWTKMQEVILMLISWLVHKNDTNIKVIEEAWISEQNE